MRPSDAAARDTQFECARCGFRTAAPSSRKCPDCSGRLRNIGVPRER